MKNLNEKINLKAHCIKVVNDANKKERNYRNREDFIIDIVEFSIRLQINLK